MALLLKHGKVNDIVVVLIFTLPYLLSCSYNLRKQVSISIALVQQHYLVLFDYMFVMRIAELLQYALCLFKELNCMLLVYGMAGE